MGVRLEPAKKGSEVLDMIEDVISSHYADLSSFQVTVGAEFAHTDPDDEEPEPPVKMFGCPSPAAPKVTPYRLRVWGVPDAVITIDAREWDARDQDQKEALIDQMLAYLNLPRDKDGAIKTDDAFRPKLALSPPDWLLAGHARVLERRGVAAAEATAFRKALTDNPKLKQLLIQFSVEGDTEYHGVESPAESYANA